MFESRNPLYAPVAAKGFVKLMTDETDRLARWGVVTILLHLPFHLYLQAILSELQEIDQPAVKALAASLSASKSLKYPFTPASLLRTYVRVRALFYLTANLYSASVRSDE